MKNKFLLILTIIPMISSAHTGHVHNMTEIMLSPSTWSDHVGIVVLFGVLVVAILRKTSLKNSIKRKKINAQL